MGQLKLFSSKDSRNVTHSEIWYGRFNNNFPFPKNTDISIYYCELLGNNTAFMDDTLISSFTAIKSKIDTIDFLGQMKIIDIEHSNIKNIILNESEHIKLTSDTIFELQALGEFKIFDLFHSNISNLYLSNCSFDNVDFRFSQLPDTLDLSNVTLKQELDLTRFPPTKKICMLNVYGADLSKIKIRYSNFKIFFPQYLGLNFEDKIYTYQELLNSLKKNGMFESYENLDKEFSAFQYEGKGNWYGSILNWIDLRWWDYGYNKFLVIRNAVLFNLLFFLINIFIFDKIIHHGYKIQKFIEINDELNRKYFGRPFQKIINKTPYIFLYTSYIFWGWKLDINAINVKNIGLFTWILSQYIIGIVCLAYIANLIITV
jgi:hypothetical protein